MANLEADNLNTALLENDTFYEQHYAQMVQLFFFYERVYRLTFSGFEHLGSAMTMVQPSLNTFDEDIWAKLNKQKIDLAFWDLIKTLAGSEKQIRVYAKEYSQILKDVNVTIPNNADMIKLIFTIMKEVIQQPHVFDMKFLYEDNNFTGSLDSLSQQYPGYLNVKLTGYPLKDRFRMGLKVASNRDPFIPFCQWLGKWSDIPNWGSETAYAFIGNFCTLFSPTFTDRGLCYTFNGQGGTSLLKRNTDYMDAFEQVFGHSVLKLGTPKVSGVGIKNGLRLVLDANVASERYKIMPKIDNTFTLDLHHPNDFPLPMMQGIQIKGGTKIR